MKCPPYPFLLPGDQSYEMMGIKHVGRRVTSEIKLTEDLHDVKIIEQKLKLADIIIRPYALPPELTLKKRSILDQIKELKENITLVEYKPMEWLTSPLDSIRSGLNHLGLVLMLILLILATVVLGPIIEALVIVFR